MPWDETQTPLGQLINRASRLLGRVADVRLKPFGVAGGQIPILSALQGGAALSQVALARLAQIEQPTMAATLTRMERDGLIQRRADPKDGRISLFSLTPVGLSKIAPLLAALAANRREMLADFDPAECRVLGELLVRVIANLEAMAAQDEASPLGQV